MRGLLLFLLFLVTALVEISFTQQFSFPLNQVPLLLAVGVLIMQRSDGIDGLLWFAAIPFLAGAIGLAQASWWVYLITGMTCFLLAKRVFTTRSVYGLMGLGFATYSLFVLLHMNAIDRPFLGYLTGLLGLGVLLFVGFSLMNRVRYVGNQVLLVRNRKRSYF